MSKCLTSEIGLKSLVDGFYTKNKHEVAKQKENMLHK